MTLKQLKSKLQNSKVLSDEVLTWITQQNYWNLWVPKSYNGLEKSLTAGLKILQSLAKINGSLGWTITLCSGANFFIGNMKPEFAQKVFETKENPILGGSGGVFGTAEKQEENYLLNGIWRYATGAPYLTHFTLNAKITENGTTLKDENGADKILSFVLPKNKVEIIEDWNTMGLKATATCSFNVKDVLIAEENTFVYNHFYLSQEIFKIDFSAFADLTLMVNYLGMVEHYLEESKKEINHSVLKTLENSLQKANSQVYIFAEEIEKRISQNNKIEEELLQNIHQTCSRFILDFSALLIKIHPFLGMKAARINHPLNQIFRDYFTATQHHNFVKRKSNLKA